MNQTDQTNQTNQMNQTDQTNQTNQMNQIDREGAGDNYYGKPGIEHLVRIDYHGSKEVPIGTCHAILRAAGLKHREE
jgi:hypothetical protein